MTIKNYEPYPQYRCAICNKEELAYKTILLEDGERACASCYFEALERGGNPLMTTKQLMDTQILQETLITNRNRYLSTLRKYSIYFEKPPLQVMDEFMNKELEIAVKKFGIRRKEMSRLQLNTFTNYLRSEVIPEYFKEKLTEKELKSINPGNYYTHRDYEEKLKTLMNK